MLCNTFHASLQIALWGMLLPLAFSTTVRAESDLFAGVAIRSIQLNVSSEDISSLRSNPRQYVRATLRDERNTLRDVAVRHVAEVNHLADEYLGARDGVEQVSAEELQERLARGDVVVLDVRPEPEYRAGHIPGARSVPRSARRAHLVRRRRRPRIVDCPRGSTTRTTTSVPCL